MCEDDTSPANYSTTQFALCMWSEMKAFVVQLRKILEYKCKTSHSLESFGGFLPGVMTTNIRLTTQYTYTLVFFYDEIFFTINIMARD